MITNYDLKGRSYVDLVDRRKQNRSLKDYIDDLFSGWLHLVLIQLRICLFPLTPKLAGGFFEDLRP